MVHVANNDIYPDLSYSQHILAARSAFGAAGKMATKAALIDVKYNK